MSGVCCRRIFNRFDIAGQDFEAIIDILNRAEAMKILETVQLQAARAHLDTMSLDEINDEIAVYRKEKNAE
jgi:NifU-like protein involved in Fe-S cluster formation